MARVHIDLILLGLLPYFILVTCKIEIPKIDLSPSAKPVLYLLGVSCFNGHKELAETVMPGTVWTVDEINKRDDILPNHELRMVWSDSGCQPGPAVFNMYKALYAPPTKIMLIGAGYSTVSQAIGLVAHLWNIVQITPLSASPALSDKTRYPLLFRISTSHKMLAHANLAIMKHFNWKKVAVIYETIEIYTSMMDELKRLLPENNITLITSEMYAYDPRVQVQNLKKLDARIIVAGFYDHSGVKILCEAYRIGLYGPKIVWLYSGAKVPGWYEPYEKDCTNEQLKIVTNWTFGFTSVSYDYKDRVGMGGYRPSQFQADFLAYMGREPIVGMTYPGKCYDSIYAAAMALTWAEVELKASGSSKKLEDFTYQDEDIRKLIYKGMHNLSFQGLKGYIKFDKFGDTLAAMRLNQFIGDDTDPVAFYSPIGDGSIEWVRELKWLGGGPPRDSTAMITELVFVDLTTYIGTCSAATLGIFLSLFFLIFNIVYRNKRFIKMSSPMMNNIIILGSILSYLTVFLQETTDNSVLLFCKLRSYSIMLSFSVAFGALFAKTWRVYMIFTRTTKRTVLKDHQLLMIVVVLAGIDVLIAVLRELLDPLSVSITNLVTIELDGGDTIITQKSMKCVSDFSNYFKAVIFGIKGILLIFGAFLSWQTRKVTIPALNDSKYIGICIYNITVLSILAVVLSFALTDRVSLSYMFTAGFIIIGTTITQLIIFIPKVLKFQSGKVDDDEMNTMGTMNVAIATTNASTNVDTGMVEGQAEELASIKGNIKDLKKELEELKKKKKK